MCSILGEIFSIVRINLMHCNQARIFLSHYLLNVSWGFTKKISFLPIVSKPIEVKEFCIHLFLYALHVSTKTLYTSILYVLCVFTGILYQKFVSITFNEIHTCIYSKFELNYSNWSTKREHERNVAGNS